MLPFARTFISPSYSICVLRCGGWTYQMDPAFADKIRHIRDPKARMSMVWSLCKTKTVCEPDDPKEEGAEGEMEEVKKGHGGCGHVQPQVRKEGLKLFLQYKKAKDDDEVCRPCIRMLGLTVLTGETLGHKVNAARHTSHNTAGGVQRF
jgi:hypothetical protein